MMRKHLNILKSESPTFPALLLMFVLDWTDALFTSTNLLLFDTRPFHVLWQRIRHRSRITCTSCVVSCFSVTQGLSTSLSPAPKPTWVITIQRAARKSRTMCSSRSTDNLCLLRRVLLAFHMQHVLWMFIFSVASHMRSVLRLCCPRVGVSNVSHAKNSVIRKDLW